MPVFAKVYDTLAEMERFNGTLCYVLMGLTLAFSSHSIGFYGHYWRIVRASKKNLFMLP